MSRLVSGPALAAGSSHRGSSENHVLVGQRSREPAASAGPLTSRPIVFTALASPS